MPITNININSFWGDKKNILINKEKERSDVNNTDIDIVLSLSDVQSYFLQKLHHADRKSLAEIFHQNDDA